MRQVDGGFVLPRGKQTFAWEGEDTLLVAREWKAGDLTSSGYPFIVKRLVRGEPLDNATDVFRGAATDGGYGVSPFSLASFDLALANAHPDRLGPVPIFEPGPRESRIRAEAHVTRDMTCARSARTANGKRPSVFRNVRIMWL